MNLKPAALFHLWAWRSLALFLLLLGAWKLADHGICWNTWLEVPATIDSVRIDEIPGSPHPNFELVVRYRFTIAETDYVSEQMDFFGRGGPVMEDPAEAELEANAIRQNPPTTCRVHPSDPTRSALFPTMELDFSLAIFGIGLVLSIVGFWDPLVKAIGRRRNPGAKSTPGVRDLLPALAIPLLLTVSVLALVAWQWRDEQAAQDWIETPATIIESSFSYADGWEPSILFEWMGEDDKPHRSRRISFAAFYGSVLEVERLVSSLEPGTETTCFLDPDDQLRAVLRRIYPMDSSGTILYASLIVLSWYGVYFYWRHVRKLPTRHVFAWFHWKSPLVPLAVAFLVGASADIRRELQLGVFLSIYQLLAITAIVILFTCGCLLFLASKHRAQASGSKT